MVRPGDRLGDRYDVIERLAAGGMGTLFRARHLELEVDVAIKVISREGVTAGSLKRFKREARAIAKLRSPNIVQVLDFGESEGQPYLVMELLRGEDLSSSLARAGKLPFERCAQVMEGVAKGVQWAHDAGIVHRDLKPGNIFLERVGDDEVVKVLDFGVAADLFAPPDPASTTGAGMVGSPAYMSPEQVWQQKVDHRADIWSMGVIAFEMLTGTNPFHAPTLAKIFERIIREPLPKPSSFDSSFPPSLDAFFERVLCRSTDGRVGSAREFAQQFRAAVASRDGDVAPNPPVTNAVETPRPTSRGAKTLRQRRRRPRLVPGSLAVKLGLSLAATAIAAMLLMRARPKPQPAVPRLTTAESKALASQSPSGESMQVARPVPVPAPSSTPTAGTSHSGPTPTSSVTEARLRSSPRSLAEKTSPAIPASDPPAGPAQPRPEVDSQFGVPLTP